MPATLTDRLRQAAAAPDTPPALVPLLREAAATCELIGSIDELLDEYEFRTRLSMRRIERLRAQHTNGGPG